MGSEQGSVTSIQISIAHGVPMRKVDSAAVIADHGIEGDRHSIAGSRRQVLLIEQETLRVLDLQPGQLKEQITTAAIDLNSLPRGTRLSIGSEVELWITSPCVPCKLMDDLRQGLREELRGRRGTLAWVKRGGLTRVGDTIQARPPRARETKS